MFAVHFASQVFPSYQSITISWIGAKTQFRLPTLLFWKGNPLAFILHHRQWGRFRDRSLLCCSCHRYDRIYFLHY
jgi:hypothetical protein